MLEALPSAADMSNVVKSALSLRASACSDVQEMDGKPALVDERTDDEVVLGYLAQLCARQQRPAAEGSVGAAIDCSSNAYVTAAGISQEVNASAVCACQP